jgi:hypothetical protein
MKGVGMKFLKMKTIRPIEVATPSKSVVISRYLKRKGFLRPFKTESIRTTLKIRINDLRKEDRHHG